MNEDTSKLLKECTSGCKMARESMGQVQQYIRDEKLKEIIESYQQKHEQLEEEAAKRLQEVGESEKEPGKMASAFSWFTTEMKLMMKEDSQQIAKLMMDGCNMGIQSVCEYKNKYGAADDEAKKLAEKLIKLEEDFMKEMEQFM